MNPIELLPVETVMKELHCSRRQAYQHMNKMGKVPIGHGLVTREALEAYKADMISTVQRQTRTLPAKDVKNLPTKGTAAERYPRQRKKVEQSC